MNPNFAQQPYWATMGPMIVITATAFVVMILEFMFRKGNRRWLALVSLAGVIVALIVDLMQFYDKVSVLLNTIAHDPLGSVFALLILITAGLVLLFTYDYSGKTKVAAEHTYLILFAVVGALAMATALDMVTLYIGLELLSVSSYVLVAVRKKSIRSVEGGAKYLIMGSIGSAVLLYGMSFLYGISGQTDLIEIGVNGTSIFGSAPAIMTLSFLLMFAGIGVKLSVVPFHMWTPDAYDGAPSPITAFLATLSKSAAFVMLLRILLFVFGPMPQLYTWVAILAAVTMVVGNLLAMPQRNMKRLLAFSSIAQAGYVLVPVALFGISQESEWYGILDSLAFYLFAYTFMTVGAFAVVHVVARARNTMDSDALLGLYRRSPWLAFALTIFLLSMAGIPLTSGFVGKLYIFTDTVHLKDLWLGIVLFAASVASFFYYFGWIKKIFTYEPDGAVGPAMRPTGTMNTLLGLCVLGTLILGLVPGALLNALGTTHWF